MKKMFRIGSLILSAVLFLTLPMSVYASDRIDVEKSQNEVLSEIEEYKNYMAIEINGVYTETISKTSFLEEHYAGAYIDRDGTYHVCMTSAEALSVLQRAVSEEEIARVKQEVLSEANLSRSAANDVANMDIKIQVRPFSYMYLSSIVEFITQKMLELNVVSVGIRQRDNVVDVSIEEKTCAEKVLFYLYNVLPDFDEKAVRFFVEEAPSAVAEKTAFPGDQIAVSKGLTSYGAGTIGFHAVDSNGDYGIVTCGHIAPEGYTAKYGGSTVGTPEYSTVGGTVDAAFIPFQNKSSLTWLSTDKIKEYDTSRYGVIYDVAEDSQIIEGARVKKYGITSGVNYGYITHTSKNISYTYELTGQSVLVYDTVEFDNITEKGDSGGPVGLVAPVAKARFYLVGMTTAKFTSSTPGGYACKVSNIMDTFDIIPVTSLNP